MPIIINIVKSCMPNKNSITTDTTTRLNSLLKMSSNSGISPDETFSLDVIVTKLTGIKNRLVDVSNSVSVDEPFIDHQGETIAIATSEMANIFRKNLYFFLL